MDWFEQLTGFRETSYADTKSKLVVEGQTLKSLVNGRSYSAGTFELVSLKQLRERAAPLGGGSGRANVGIIVGDVGELHRRPENQGALFQVASQFNMLEMIGPEVTPEQGVTRYQHDGTQGPACAIAAGAATIYRNYFVPVGDQVGQTAANQLDGFAPLAMRLTAALGHPAKPLVAMRNGYAIFTETGLRDIDFYLASLSEVEVDDLRSELQVGIHSDVEVTGTKHRVTQVFCSALPVGYHKIASPWARLSTLVLEAAYEATVLCAASTAHQTESRTVFLTALGGGVFGNDEIWIHQAIRRALDIVRGFDLEIKIVSYGSPPHSLTNFVEDLNR